MTSPSRAVAEPSPPTAEDIAARDGALRDDLEDGLRFTHVMAAVTRREVLQTATTVFALIEELKDKGEIDAEEHERRTAMVQSKEVDRIDLHLHIRLEQRIDKYAITELPDIDCEARIHLCRGRCCTLHFPLSHQDLDERVVKWDYLKPYVIRQRESDGYCVHNDPATKGCHVYHHRPAVCRSYSCKEDKRIWIDFEKRIPAIDPKLEPKNAPVPDGEPPK
jgi:Fe-S-cluster containining protein